MNQRAVPVIGDGRKVFVVHGRNDAARDAMFAFLRSLDLSPIEWSDAVSLTGQGSPFIGNVLEGAFSEAQAVVVLLTPDDIAYLKPTLSTRPNDPDLEPRGQARPNVLFEAGMAFGRHADRTIIVELGDLRPFSDVAGRHAVRMNSSAEKRQELRQRLETAGCAVKTTGIDWLTAGDFAAATPAEESLPIGKRFPTAKHANSLRLDAKYFSKGKGAGTLRIDNLSNVDAYNVEFKIPEEAKPSFHVHADLPIKKLPAGKSVPFSTISFLGSGAETFEVEITAKTPEGDDYRIDAFISLGG